MSTLALLWCVAAFLGCSVLGMALAWRGGAATGGVKDVIPVDVHIRGCPPTPTALLSGLLALLEYSRPAR